MPGFAAVFVGVGLGRFAYAPIVPFLAQVGIDPVAAGYAGAANLAGYFAGAALAYRIGRTLGPGRGVRLALCLSIVSFLASGLPLGFVWLAVWRLVVGATGAILMILGPSLMLSRVEPGVRGRTAGVIMTGAGLGVVLASLVVTPLASLDVRYFWFALAGLAGLATVGSWRAWSPRSMPLPMSSGAEIPGIGADRAYGAAILLIIFAYACDGAGFVPHTIFWVDYVARSLGFGPLWGALSWLGFGVGALVGPVAAGSLADRLGLGRTLVVAFLVKAIGVALAIVMPGPATLTLSAFLVGALSPGMASLVSARLHELVNRQAHGRAWGFATLGFSAAQAAGGLAMSRSFAVFQTYTPLYGAGALLEALGVVLSAWALRAARGR